MVTGITMAKCNGSNKVKIVSNYFVDFSNNTSIHGFKFLVENKRLAAERLWWLTVLCVCAYTCINLILLTLKQWEENPVFIGISQKSMHLWDVPFPALTVCPEVKIKRTSYNYTYYSKKNKAGGLTDEELKRFMDATLFCDTPSNLRGLSLSESHTVNIEDIDFLIDQAHVPEDILWYSAPYDFRSFSRTLTNFGVCFTYNMLDRSEIYNNVTYIHKNFGVHPQTLRWNVDTNYDRTRNDTFPRRATTIADIFFMQMYTTTEEEDLVCNYMKGYKIILHHPAETPILSTRYLSVSSNTQYKILTKPRVTMTPSNLRKYDPHERNCFFSEERYLKFYNIYTQHNCKVECLANYTLQMCGCSLYYMPHEAATKICGTGDLKCASNAQKELQQIEMETELGSTRNENNVIKSCDCLPSCTSITYNVETTRQDKVEGDVGELTVSEALFEFNEIEIPTMKRRELFSNADFWANCGGLLGLFTGFSVISFAEIVYFLSLRWLCNLWKYGTKFWTKKIIVVQS